MEIKIEEIQKRLTLLLITNKLKPIFYDTIKY